MHGHRQEQQKTILDLVYRMTHPFKSSHQQWRN